VIALKARSCVVDGNGNGNGDGSVRQGSVRGSDGRDIVLNMSLSCSDIVRKKWRRRARSFRREKGTQQQTRKAATRKTFHVVGDGNCLDVDEGCDKDGGFEEIPTHAHNDLAPPNITGLNLADVPEGQVNLSDISDEEEAPPHSKVAPKAKVEAEAVAKLLLQNKGSVNWVIDPVTQQRVGNITEVHGIWGINLTIQCSAIGHKCARKMVQTHRIRSMEHVRDWLLSGPTLSEEVHQRNWANVLVPPKPRSNAARSCTHQCIVFVLRIFAHCSLSCPPNAKL
jgi:hypothetical protein